jgi:hypothetical protein
MGTALESLGPTLIKMDPGVTASRRHGVTASRPLLARSAWGADFTSVRPKCPLGVSRDDSGQTGRGDSR